VGDSELHKCRAAGSTLEEVIVARDTVDDFSRTIPIIIGSGCCRTGPIKIGRFVCQPFDAAVGAGDGGSDGLLWGTCF